VRQTLDEIDVESIRKSAEEYYREGEFYCSEAIVSSFIEELDLDLSRDVVAMMSGFPVGIGGSGCTCGAISGAVAMLGYFFGRREPGASGAARTMELTAELHDRFIEEEGSTCCRVLTAGMDFDRGEHLEQCIEFTGRMAALTAEIIKRENGID